MSGNNRDEFGKLPFKAPKLEVYGRARDITRNTGKTSTVADSGSSAAGDNKTR
jgi:hypothetical protein